MKGGVSLEYIKAFEEYLYENDKSKNTVNAYVSDIKDFLNFYKKDIKDLDKSDIREYTEHLINKEFTIKTINRKLVSLHQYIEYLNYFEDYKIVIKVKQLKVEQQNFINDMLDISSVRRIVRAADKRNDIRAVTMFYTLFYTGMRVSEMLKIGVQSTIRAKVTLRKLVFHKLQYMYLWKPFYCLINEGF